MVISFSPLHLDYRWYYVDKEYAAPKILKRYTPAHYAMFFQHGKNDYERLIFPVEGPYDETEESKYEEWKEYCESNDISFPEFVTKRDIMRFIVCNKFKIKDAVKNLQQNIDFMEDLKPIYVTDTMKEILESGYIYLHGRDRSLRPICINNLGVISKHDFDVHDAYNTNWFVIYYLIDHILVPEKVENWIMVSDMDGLSMTKIPTKVLKACMKSAQDNLKSRVSFFYYVNVTWGLRATWTLIKPFLDKRIKNKTTMIGGQIDSNFLACAHPSQIEEKYGGEAPDVTQYWPPYHVSDEYDVNPDCISATTPKSGSKTKSNTDSE